MLGKKCVLWALLLMMFSQVVGAQKLHDDVRMTVNGVSLLRADYCETYYQDGMPNYVFRHNSWGPKAVVRLKRAPSLTSDVSTLRILTTGFQDVVKLEIVPVRKPGRHLTQTFEDECYVCFDTDSVYIDIRARDRFEEAEEAVKEVASHVVFSTPDVMVNTFGGIIAVGESVKNEVNKVSLIDSLLLVPSPDALRDMGQVYTTTKYLEREMPYLALSGTEKMFTALTYFNAGRREKGYSLLTGNMSDVVRGDAQAGSIKFNMTARTVVQGLFGIHADASRRCCIISPGFPEAWDSASIRTPYIYYRYKRYGEELVYEVSQQFSQPQKIIIRQHLGQGRYRDVEGSADRHQTIRCKLPLPLPEVRYVPDGALSSYPNSIQIQGNPSPVSDEPDVEAKFHKQNLTKVFNANAGDLPGVSDSVFRTLLAKDEFVVAGVPFRTPAEGNNIALASLSADHPASVSIPLSGMASKAWLLLAGTSGYLHRHIVSGLIVAQYKDGSADTLQIVSPDNFCSSELACNIDVRATPSPFPRPYRVSFATGTVSRDLAAELGLRNACPDIVYGRHACPLSGGAAQMLCIPLDNKRKLRSLTLRTLSDGVVIGLMAVTLQ